MTRNDDGKVTMLKNLRIATKMYVCFATLVMLMVIVGAFAHSYLTSVTDAAAAVGRTRVPGMRSLQNIAIGQLRVGAGVHALNNRRMMAPKIRQENYEEVTKGFEILRAARANYEGLEHTQDESKLWRSLSPVLEAWQTHLDGVISTHHEKDALVAQGLSLDDPKIAVLDARAFDMTTRARDARVESGRMLAALTDLNASLGNEAVRFTASQAATGNRLILFAILLGVGVSIALAFAISRSVNDAICSLQSESRRLTQAAVEGQLSVRGNVMAIPKEFRPVIQGVNDTLDALIEPLDLAANYVDKLSKGQLPPKIAAKYQGDFNTLKNNLNQCIEAIECLIADSARLTTSAVDGNLSIRADASKHLGDYRKIIGGFNDTLDAVIGPLNVAADYVDKISQGRIPARISADYRGDFNTLKDNLNRCVDAINLLISDTQVLARAAVDGQLCTRADPLKHAGDFRRIVTGVNATLDAVIQPLNVAAECVHRISRGDMPPKITASYTGDFGTLKNNLNQCIDAINLLITDTSMLARAAVDGKLATRADFTRHAGDFRAIVVGINSTLDAVINPLSVAATYVDRISKGDIPPKITEEYSGDFAGLRNNLNQCIEAIERLVADAAGLARRAVDGDLSARADAQRHDGDYRKIVTGFNDTLDAVIGPLNVAADYVDRISKGNVPPRISAAYAGDFNTIKSNLNQCIDAINLLITDTQMLAEAAVAGKLSTRANASKHSGDFGRIVSGVNATLDAVILPLNVAASCVDRISRGDIPPKITESYAGDFGALKSNLNQCIDAVVLLVADVKMLAGAAVEGKLRTRANAAAHQGDFRTIVAGVNATLDAVINPLTVAATYVDRISKGDIPPKITDAYEGDFAAIRNNLNQCIDAVNLLIGDTQALSVAAIEGKLSTRSDASRHSGDFRRIVDGVNQTLDAIVSPILEATRVLELLAQYDLRARVQGAYQGDHARIKEALNGTGAALHDALSQVAEAVEQVSEAAKQIASSSQSVAQGASEQASSLEETSSSLEEMASMTRQNADNTVQARTLAQATKQAAENGGRSMHRMTDAMDKIRTAAEGTAQIIRDINDIAFQTNLLALNAAVEAARAGEAGRGFAVVAEEVRNLAQRSKEAAKKTEDLIRMSVGNAENGRVITNEVASGLAEIVNAASKVNDIIGEIAVASQEQSRGIEQVNAAVSEMDKVVQLAAANAEQSSSASEELSSQSEELAGLVSRFQLDSSLSRSIGTHLSPAKELRLRGPVASPPRRVVSKPVRARAAAGGGVPRSAADENELGLLHSDVEFKEF